MLLFPCEDHWALIIIIQLVGIVGDRLGHLPVLSLCQCMGGIAQMAIWPFASSLPSLMAFSSIYGFFTGGYVSLYPVGMLFASDIGTQIYLTTIQLLLICTASKAWQASLESCSPVLWCVHTTVSMNSLF